jgi:hypothetical protein
MTSDKEFETMNVPSPYSAIIERMRIERNVPTSENRKTWAPGPVREVPPTWVKIHKRVRRLRKACRMYMGLRNATEIRAVTEDVQTLLLRCLYHLRRERVVHEERRRQAAARRRAARSEATRPARGRPPGSAKLAALQLEQGVAQIWFEFTGRWPTRRFDAWNGREYGPFHEFLQAVRDILPRSIFVRSKGNVPKVDFAVRRAIAELHEAQAAPDEYRHRGLIDEKTWLTSNCEQR